MADYDVTAKDSALEFDTVQGTDNACFKIDSTHVINFWAGSGSDGFVQVFSIDETTKEVTAEGSALEYDTDRGISPACFQIDSNHFINFWQGTDTDGFAQVFTVNLSTWAVTAEGTALEFDTTFAGSNSCFEIDSNHFINFWQGTDGDGFAQVFTVNLSTWAVTAEGTALEYDTADAGSNSCFQVDSNHFINFWGGTSNHGFVQVFTVNLGTWAVTAEGTALEFDTSTGINNSCYQVDSNHFINFWRTSSFGGRAQVFTVNLGTWAVTAEGTALTITGSLVAMGLGRNCFQVDSNHFINFWAGPGTDGFTQVFTVNLGTWAVTAEGTALEFDTVQGNNHACTEIGTGFFINFWAGSGSDGFVQVFEVELPAAAATFTPKILYII